MKRYYGKLLGFVAGWLLMRHPAGGVLGLAIGHAFDADWLLPQRAAPYKVLGLTRDASDEDVDRTYRKLMSQYHPDRVANAAPELREQAAQRAAEINAAYTRIRGKRRRR
ncbi:J domain-containing protein [Luteimonas abyssi]|uniref:J domain-containing protein n=1 Tax=Luteimonas abyssi TaxID=1247514 RepID=UPI000737B95B|nr:DnaJ domain-containing protein [Luteimonas abyssi]